MRDFSVSFQRRKRNPAETALAMNEDAFVIAQVTQFVWFDLVLFGRRIVHRPLAGSEAPRAFDHALLAEKVGALHRVSFIRRPENHPVAKIEGQDPGFVVSKRGDE